MYAIVDLAGKQFRVEEGQTFYVNRLSVEEGSKVTFDKVLMIDANGKLNVGQPVIEGAAVEATVITHLKGDKILVFKKKRRKGYQTLNGHRQLLSQIKIDKISEKAAKRKAVKAKVEESTPDKADENAE